MFVSRSQIPGVMVKRSSQQRLARGRRKFNRRFIASYRHNYEPRSPVALSLPEQPQPPKPSGSSITRLFSWQIGGTAKNQRGDCPKCGGFGAHPQHAVLVNNKETKLRRCSSCRFYFYDLPAEPAPPPGPKLEVLDVDRLLRARVSWNDCPNCGTDTKNTVIVRDRRSGDIVETYRCMYGHYFRDYYS